jgi:hypothetical protein
MNSDPMAVAARPAANPQTARPRAARSAAATLKNVLVRHRWLIAIVLAYVAAAVIVGRVTDNAELVRIRIYSTLLLMLFACFVVLLVLGHTFWVMIALRPEGSLTIAIIKDFKQRFLKLDRLASFVLMAMLMPFFFSGFSSFKRMLPHINYWHLDPLFAEWDRFVHFGNDAWQLTHAVFGTPLMTTAINFVYHTWLFLMLGVLIWQALEIKRPQLRAQFFYSFIAVWILIGTVCAFLMSAAGPVYYEFVTGSENPFWPLMERLYAFDEVSPVWALRLQEELWMNHTFGSTDLKTGITAMPSMHVAVAVHFALLGWRYNRLAGIGFTAFAVAIEIGSVHLGWHYAIDGYISTVMVVVIWLTVGWLLRRSADESETTEERRVATSVA